MPNYADMGSFERNYLNFDPEAGFFRYLRDSGLLGSAPIDKYAQGRYNNVYGDYRAIAGQDPNLGFFDYLQQRQPNFSMDFGSLSPETRGDFTSFKSAPRARFLRAY